jgi:hypothetical protein
MRTPAMGNSRLAIQFLVSFFLMLLLMEVAKVLLMLFPMIRVMDL